VLAILERYGSVDYAMTSAAEHAEQARRAISHFPDTEIKRALQWIPDFVVGRDK
jgi:geranylgeranyl pyrophosphate synthase